MIGLVLGTKAEFLRCLPLLRLLEEKKVDYTFIHTGQNSLDSLTDEFPVHFPHRVAMTSLEGVSTSAVRALRSIPSFVAELRSVMAEVKPQYVVCHGDTLTTFGVALAGRDSRYQLAHIEAGFRSNSLLEPFPEEGFRTIADRRSQILFAPSRLAVWNLRKERVKGEILLTGSTVPDLVRMASSNRGFDTEHEGSVLVTTHRFENIFNRSRLKRIVRIIGLSRLHVCWPVHEITQIQLRRFDLFSEVRRMNVELLSPLPYTHFIQRLKHSNYVITDGGSIEEESIILGKPCLLLRKRTERKEAIDLGLTFLTNLDIGLAKRIIERVEHGTVSLRLPNPYFAGRSATELILNRLTSHHQQPT